MKILHKISAALLLAASLTASAQDPWLHIYYPNGSNYQGFDMSEIIEITFDEESGSMVVSQSNGNTTTLYGSQMDYFHFGPNVASLRIDIPSAPDLGDVYSKSEYLDATLTFEGRGHQEDFQMDVQVRGRGNSTWGYPKKPYRLKFASKQRMLLPKKAKNFVLLANYIDDSMMRNFATFKFGEMIGMPWINHSVPVDVYFNNDYKGSYMLTEKVGFNNGSVDLKSADEPNSIMLEFDTYGFSFNSQTGAMSGPSDEIYFASAPYNSSRNFVFPVTVKDPDAPEDPAALEAWISEWKADLDELMSAVDQKDTQKMYELCDLESLVRYIMVFNLSCNQEIDHPKSVYVYKTKGGKWNFGPCWDFDWAFGYSPTYTNYGGDGSWANPLLSIGRSNDDLDGHAGYFFYTLCNTPEFKARFNEIWNEFLTTGQEQFWADFDAYAAALRPSANLNGLIGTGTQYRKFDDHVASIRAWIQNRINFITNDSNHGLWQTGAFSGY